MFHEWLSLMMRAHAVTQREIAAATGKSQQAVSSWATGRTRPGADVIGALARVLGVEVEEVVDQLAASPLPTEPPPDPMAELEARVEALEQQLKRVLPRPGRPSRREKPA